MKSSRRELSIGGLFIMVSLKITKLLSYPVLSSYLKQILVFTEYIMESVLEFQRRKFLTLLLKQGELMCLVVQFEHKL